MFRRKTDGTVQYQTESSSVASFRSKSDVAVRSWTVVFPFQKECDRRRVQGIGNEKARSGFVALLQQHNGQTPVMRKSLNNKVVDWSVQG